MSTPLKPVLLFAHTSMDALANAIVSECDEMNLHSSPSDANLLLHVSYFQISLLSSVCLHAAIAFVVPFSFE
jgi:hypothetical protein